MKIVVQEIRISEDFRKTVNSKQYKKKEFTEQFVSTRGRLYFPNKTILWLIQVVQL